MTAYNDSNNCHCIFDLIFLSDNHKFHHLSFEDQFFVKCMRKLLLFFIFIIKKIHIFLLRNENFDINARTVVSSESN